jgi:hypothetical protein
VSLAARLSGTVLFTELRFRFVVAIRALLALLSFDNAAEPHFTRSPDVVYANICSWNLVVNTLAIGFL